MSDQEKEVSHASVQNNKSLEEMIKENHKTRKYDSREKKFTKKPSVSKTKKYQNDKYENKYYEKHNYQPSLSFKSKVIM